MDGLGWGGRGRSSADPQRRAGMVPWAASSACHGCFQKLFYPAFSRAQACLCSCFPRGTFSSLQSWCQSGSRAARESRCVVDKVRLPVKKTKVIFAHFSVFPLQAGRCWTPTPPAQWHGPPKSPGFLCSQRWESRTDPKIK